MADDTVLDAMRWASEDELRFGSRLWDVPADFLASLIATELIINNVHLLVVIFLSH